MCCYQELRRLVGAQRRRLPCDFSCRTTCASATSSRRRWSASLSTPRCSALPPPGRAPPRVPGLRLAAHCQQGCPRFVGVEGQRRTISSRLPAFLCPQPRALLTPATGCGGSGDASGRHWRPPRGRNAPPLRFGAQVQHCCAARCGMTTRAVPGLKVIQRTRIRRRAARKPSWPAAGRAGARRLAAACGPGQHRALRCRRGLGRHRCRPRRRPRGIDALWSACRATASMRRWWPSSGACARRGCAWGCSPTPRRAARRARPPRRAGGWLPVDVQVFSYAAGALKPDLRTYRPPTALQAAPKETLFIDDAPPTRRRRAGLGITPSSSAGCRRCGRLQARAAGGRRRPGGAPAPSTSTRWCASSSWGVVRGDLATCTDDEARVPRGEAFPHGRRHLLWRCRASWIHVTAHRRGPAGWSDSSGGPPSSQGR